MTLWTFIKEWGWVFVRFYVKQCYHLVETGMICVCVCVWQTAELLPEMPQLSFLLTELMLLTKWSPDEF